MLEKYNEIWDKINNVIEKVFDTQSVFKGKYLETSLKYYNVKNTHFLGTKVPKESVNCLCITLIVLDSVFKIKTKIITHKNKKNLNTL